MRPSPAYFAEDNAAKARIQDALLVEYPQSPVKDVHYVVRIGYKQVQVMRASHPNTDGYKLYMGPAAKSPLVVAPSVAAVDLPRVTKECLDMIESVRDTMWAEHRVIPWMDISLLHSMDFSHAIPEDLRPTTGAVKRPSGTQPAIKKTPPTKRTKK